MTLPRSVSRRMGRVLHLVSPIKTQEFYCQNRVDEDTICGFRWTLDIPTAGKLTYQIACLRCGRAYEVTVKAPKAPKPKPPQPRQPPKPHPVCLHNRGTGYTDQRGRHRCSACGALTDAEA